MQNTDTKHWLTKYWGWLFDLPDLIGTLLLMITITAPIFIVIFVLYAIIGFSLKETCLDSQYPRRWNKGDTICEEYHDGEWVKVNPSNDKIYYYNDIASGISE